MHKKYVLSLFVVTAMVLMSMSAFAIKSVDIQNNVSLTGYGSSQIGSFTIKNTGDETVDVSFSSTILIDSAGHYLTMSSIPSLTGFGPSQVRTLNFDVNMTGYAGSYTSFITANVGGIAMDYTNMFVTITDNGLGLFVTPVVLSTAYADSSVSQPVTIENRGNKDITATVSRSGYSEMSYFTFDKEGSVTFPALSTTTATAKIAVPAGLATGTYSGRVDYTAGSIVSSTILQTAVQPTYKVSATSAKITFDPGSSSSGTVTIKNSGNINLNGLSIINIPLVVDNDGDMINITVTPNSSINLSVGSSVSATIKADSSKKIDSGSYKATMAVSGGSVNAPFDLELVVNELLRVSDVTFPDDFSPGDSVDIDVEVENIADDVDIKDVKVKVYLLDSSGNKLQDENDDDLKDESEKFKLDSGDSNKVKFQFTMPYDVENDDEVTIRIEVTGKNADDTSEVYDVVDESNTMTANREDHKIDIYRASFDASTLSCSRNTYLRVSMRDIGNEDEDDVELAVVNAALGLDKHEIFDMSSDPDDDNFEVEKSIYFDLKNTPVGQYDVEVTVYYNEGDDKEQIIVPVTVAACTGTVTPTSTGSTGTSTGTGSTSGTPAGTASADNVQFTYTGASGIAPVSGYSTVTAATPRISQTSGKSFTESTGFYVLMGFTDLLLVVLIVGAIVYALRK